jgi:DNA helicase-2/ATP-dependent DNA helicase PcrA
VVTQVNKNSELKTGITMQLSDQQKAAVEHIGTPALVIAGAGSGKTRTLTAKISWLISKGYDPKRILAITFTNKAAQEMKVRLVEATGRRAADFPWVRTYHSACFAILKLHCGVLGYQSTLQILSTYHQKKLMQEIAIAQDIDKKHLPGIMSDISRSKNFGNPEKYFDTLPLVKRSTVMGVYYAYEKQLKNRNSLDFDNILLLTRDILRDHKEIREQYRKSFDFILVDEYQDTNNIQEEITQLLLGHGNLFCVGDDWQAVYGFRGSNVKHFLSFPDKYANAKIFKLEQNYRSADEIVKLANDLIGNNSTRMDKKCFSDKKGAVIETHALRNEYEEAEWVGRKLKAMNRAGTKYGETAIMYRTKACSLWFEKTLRSMRIPYKMVGSKGFFDRREILDINCYLICSFYKSDDVSFARIVNTPKRGIGPAMIKKISQARTPEMSLLDSTRKMIKERVLSKKIHDELTRLVALLDDIKEMQPADAIREVISRLDYYSVMSAYSQTGEEADTRRDNIDELIHSASMAGSMQEYLEEVALVNEDKKDEDDSGGGVNLSTIHASKGLEYKLAFIVGMEEELFPHWKSLASESELQEERRLMYVALTRAEQYLYITSAAERRKRSTITSRFVHEIEEALD